jgi:1,2-diacylglycerol 3-alpha-glucosyltransferase
LKVAFFSDSYLPVLNGVSIAIRTLVEELRAQGVRVYVFAPGLSGQPKEDPFEIRFPAVMTPWAKGYPLAYPPFRRTRKHFLPLDVDLVHTHTPYTVGFCGLRWAKATDTPVISTYHTLYENYAHYVPIFPERDVSYKIQKHTSYFYNEVSRVITPSDAAKDSLLRHDVRRPIDVMPTGIPQRPPMARQVARGELRIPDREFMLLYVGRLAREKNLELLIGCLRRWRATIPNVRLHLVGGGKWGDEVWEWAKSYAVADILELHGQQQSRDVLNTFFAASDVFVFPSLTETQGLVIGEALATGLPAVAVEGGGARETITDGEDGFVVPDTIEAFAARVEQLAHDGALRATMGGKARVAAGCRTPAQAAQRVLAVYREVLGMPEGASALEGSVVRPRED